MEDRIDYILENIVNKTFVEMAQELGITKQAVHQYVQTHPNEINTSAILKRISIGQEQWKPLVYQGMKFEKYYISNFGRIYVDTNRKLLDTNCDYITIYYNRKKYVFLIDVVLYQLFMIPIDYNALIIKLDRYGYKVKSMLLEPIKNEFNSHFIDVMSLPNELWKGMRYNLDDVDYDFSDLYLISNLGRIYSLRWCSLVKASSVGYPHIRFQTPEIDMNIMVNRAVAYNFIPNYDNKGFVLIKDNNPLNCCVDNLAWCDFNDAILNYHKNKSK